MSAEADHCLSALLVAVLPLAVAGPLHLAGVEAEGPMAYGTMAFYIAGSLWLAQRRGRTPADIGLRRKGLLASLALSGLLLATILVAGGIGSDLEWRRGVPAGRLAERAAYCFLFSGPGQEILFRGLMLFAVLRWKGPGVALVASSLLYGLAHFRAGPTGMALNAAVGAWYGIAVLASRNVWGAALVHGTHNFLFGYLLRAGGAVL